MLQILTETRRSHQNGGENRARHLELKQTPQRLASYL